MHVFHRFALYILCSATIPTLVSAALILPFGSSSSSDVTNAFSNRSCVEMPDERFRVVPTFDEPHLPMSSGLMNVVKSLESLAYIDFSGNMEA